MLQRMFKVLHRTQGTLELAVATGRGTGDTEVHHAKLKK